MTSNAVAANIEAMARPPKVLAMIDFCIMKYCLGTSYVVGSFGVQQCHLLGRLLGGCIFVNAAIRWGM